MPRLIVFAGLPGTGKSTLARELAQRTGAAWLRIDSLEQAILASGVAADGDLRDAGYRAAQAAAHDNLALGRDVVADCVNPWKLTRDAWQETGRAAHAEVIWIENVCSDPAEHRRRAETRTPDIPGHILPTWADVVARDDHPWDRERLVMDTAGRSVGACVEVVVAGLELR